MNASVTAPDTLRAVPRTTYAGLSTGVRLLLWMTAALLPLGLIAVFASVESAQSNRLKREADARAMATAAARQLSAMVARRALELRVLAADLATGPITRASCERRVLLLRAAQRFPVGYVLYDGGGREICRSAGFSAVPVRATGNFPESAFDTEVRLLPETRALRFESRSRAGEPYGIGEVPAAMLADAARPITLTGEHSILLRQGERSMALVTARAAPPSGREVMVSAPAAGGQLQLDLTLTDLRVSAAEVVLTLLPMLMWLAAGLIGWLVVSRLVIRPLHALQQAVAGHRVGEGPLTLPDLATPATEIRGLGKAFRDLTDQLAQHEHALEAGLARQTKLTREVHHRVKNNLQVVSSLINLHARGVDDPAVAAAYASIQRRVDALAVVHRNHFAELEENRGVALRSLIGELAANLRATAPPGAGHLAITLDIAPLYATQDVAVPVAFLVTEIVELAMSCAPRDRVAISLVPAEREGRATLSIAAAGLSESACLAHPSAERFGRVVEGLSRQLRAALVRDHDQGRFTIDIAAHV